MAAPSVVEAADPDDRPDLLTHACAAHAAGLCVLPPRQDGSKQPDASSWTRYQKERSTPDELHRWYAGGTRTGIGHVCGAVSGHLELFEFDDRAVYDAFLGAAAEAGLGDLVARVRAGYEEETPGGGIHWLYRLADVGGGAKTVALARRPGTDGTGRPRHLPLIETKGEGGYAVAAPSHGPVHPSGRPYRLLTGGVAAIVTLIATERDALWSLARAFDEVPKVDMPRADAMAGTRVSVPGPGGGQDHGRWLLRPGDAFDARASWEEVLGPHGWEAVRRKGEATLWRRPDGHPGGWGAATNHRGSDRLYVWTTATALEPDRAYTKFAALAVLEHGGDFAATARALEARGYGERRVSPTTGSPPGSPPGAPPGSSPPPVLPTLVAVPPFPLDALPAVARVFVAAGAEALGCPPDFIVPHLLGFCGAVAGNGRKLQVKPGYVIAPIFWAGVVGRPGTVKTPALNHARRPVDTLQQEAWAAYLLAIAAWEEQPPGARGARPRAEHIFATDTTTEAVAFALGASRGLAIIHDELAGWVGSFDAYRKAGDRQSWLSAWSGAPLKPNRKTGEPIYVPDPVVCVLGGVQPDVLPGLAGEAARDDGFIPRLLLAWPDAEPAAWTDAVVAPHVGEAMLAVVRDLRLPRDETAVTTLSEAAYGEWKAWHGENRSIVAASAGLAAGWAAKAPVHLARIALVLHLLAHPRDLHRPLGVETLRDGIAILEYFRAHLGRVLPAFGAAAPVGQAGLAARVHRRLERTAPDWVGRAELRAQLGGHDPAEAVGATLAALEEAGRAERRTVATRGRAREEWRAVSPENEGPTDPAGATGERELTVRDKWKDVGSPPASGFSRNHVITPGTPSNAPQPTDAWERWEEPL